MAQINLPPQGTLNRLLTSLVVPQYPLLNVSASFQGKRAVSIAFEGTTSTAIPTQTGVVQSPEPYQLVMISVNLLKSQGFSYYWRLQQELNVLLGPITVYLDSVVFPEYTFTNCAIQGVRELTGGGSDADYMVMVSGVYNINAALYQ